jgi:hypothetical protein
MITLIFEPNRVFVFDFDVDVALFLVEILRLGIGCLSKLRLSRWQVGKRFFSETKIFFSCLARLG